MTGYDYIIVGGGASGLQLADALGSDPYFSNKRIALIEQQHSRSNDRTWCFWEQGEGTFDNILHHSWDYIRFAGPGFDRTEALDPFRYKMVRASDFYREYQARIARHANIESINATVRELQQVGDGVRVETDSGHYHGIQVFTSVYFGDREALMQPYPVLRQHFLGWFIRSENPVFDPRRATFMDFDIPQRGNTRFMYLLPFSATEGLVEYTLFSGQRLEQQEYEEALKTYLADRLGSVTYEILETEQGSIPMTCNDFSRADRPGITHIGIAGGWAKASTGYTFHNISRKIPKLLQAIKEGTSLKMAPRNRFWHYDRLLLDVLSRENHRGCEVFSGQLRNLPPQLMLRFLNEQTRVPEEVRVMAASPPTPFIRAVWRSLF